MTKICFFKGSKYTAYLRELYLKKEVLIFKLFDCFKLLKINVFDNFYNKFINFNFLLHTNCCNYSFETLIFLITQLTASKRGGQF